jgi:hypothetical protein
MSVLVEDAAEAVASAYVEAGGGVRLGGSVTAARAAAGRWRSPGTGTSQGGGVMAGATGPVSAAHGRPVEVTEERGNEV